MYKDRTQPIGYCQRCNDVQNLADLMADGEIPNLRVCKECYDPLHPLSKPAPARKENLSLTNPSPWRGDINEVPTPVTPDDFP